MNESSCKRSTYYPVFLLAGFQIPRTEQQRLTVDLFFFRVELMSCSVREIITFLDIIKDLV